MENQGRSETTGEVMERKEKVTAPREEGVDWTAVEIIRNAATLGLESKILRDRFNFLLSVIDSLCARSDEDRQRDEAKW